MRQSMTSRLTFTHQSSVSVVIQQLVRQGFVAKVASSHDRRRQRLAVTTKGRRVLGRAPVAAQEHLIETIAARSHDRWPRSRGSWLRPGLRPIRPCSVKTGLRADGEDRDERIAPSGCVGRVRCRPHVGAHRVHRSGGVEHGISTPRQLFEHAGRRVTLQQAHQEVMRRRHGMALVRNGSRDHFGTANVGMEQWARCAARLRPVNVFQVAHAGRGRAPSVPVALYDDQCVTIHQRWLRTARIGVACGTGIEMNGAHGGSRRHRRDKVYPVDRGASWRDACGHEIMPAQGLRGYTRFTR